MKFFFHLRLLPHPLNHLGGCLWFWHCAQHFPPNHQRRLPSSQHCFSGWYMSFFSIADQYCFQIVVQGSYLICFFYLIRRNRYNFWNFTNEVLKLFLVYFKVLGWFLTRTIGSTRRSRLQWPQKKKRWVLRRLKQMNPWKEPQQQEVRMWVMKPDTDVLSYFTQLLHVVF